MLMINLFTDASGALSDFSLQAQKMANDSAWVKKRFAQLSASSKMDGFLKETSRAFNITLKMLRSYKSDPNKQFLFIYQYVSIEFEVFTLLFILIRCIIYPLKSNLDNIPLGL